MTVLQLESAWVLEGPGGTVATISLTHTSRATCADAAGPLPACRQLASSERFAAAESSGWARIACSHASAGGLRPPLAAPAGADGGLAGVGGAPAPVGPVAAGGWTPCRPDTDDVLAAGAEPPVL